MLKDKKGDIIVPLQRIEVQSGKASPEFVSCTGIRSFLGQPHLIKGVTKEDHVDFNKFSTSLGSLPKTGGFLTIEEVKSLAKEFKDDSSFIAKVGSAVMQLSRLAKPVMDAYKKNELGGAKSDAERWVR